MMTTRLLVAAGLVAGATNVGAAQDHRDPTAWKGAKGWRAVMDQPAPDSLLFSVDMPPGWHITARGPGALLGDTSWRSAGVATVEAEIFLFPSSTEREYGLFVGGSGLDSGSPAWTGVLLRRDGSWAVARGRGSSLEMIRDWTPNAAVNPAGAQAVKNVLSVSLDAGRVTVRVNGVVVGDAALPSADAADGAVGIRVGPGLNLHVTRVTITPGKGG